MVTIIKLCCFVCDIRNSVHDGFSYFPAWYAIPDLTKLLILYVVSNGLTGLFAPNGTLAWGAPEPQVIPPIPDLDSGFSGSTRHYYHATLGTSVVQGPAWPKAQGFGLASRGFGLRKSKPGPAFRLWLCFGLAWPEPGLTILGGCRKNIYVCVVLVVYSSSSTSCKSSLSSRPSTTASHLSSS